MDIFFVASHAFFGRIPLKNGRCQANEGINGQPLELGDAGIQFTNELASSLKLKNTHVFYPFNHEYEQHPYTTWLPTV